MLLSSFSGLADDVGAVTGNKKLVLEVTTSRGGNIVPGQPAPRHRSSVIEVSERKGAGDGPSFRRCCCARGPPYGQLLTRT